MSRPGPDDAVLDELAALVQVDPSADFVARVRLRVAADGMERRSGAPAWLLLPAATVVAAGLVLWVRSDRPAPLATAPRPAMTQPLTEIPPPLAVAVRPPAELAKLSSPRLLPAAAPEVLISPDEADAIALLMASVRDGRLDPSAVPDFSNVLKPSIDIASAAFEPIYVEPLAEIPPLEE